MELDEARLLEVHERLLRYARAELRKVPQQHRSGMLNAEDLVAHAMEIAFRNYAGAETRRRWDPLRVDMLTFCKGVIRSDISSHSKSSRRRIMISIDFNSEESVISANDNQEDLLIFNQLKYKLMAALSADVEALHLLGSIYRGEWTTEEAFAQDNAIALEAVKATKRRIRRRAARLLERANG